MKKRERADGDTDDDTPFCFVSHKQVRLGFNPTANIHHCRFLDICQVGSDSLSLQATYAQG